MSNHLLTAGILLTKPQIITGTEKLVAAMTPWLIGLVAGIVALVEAYNGICYMQASEDEQRMIRKKMKSILFTGVLIITIVGSVNFVFSFYQ